MAKRSNAKIIIILVSVVVLVAVASFWIRLKIVAPKANYALARTVEIDGAVLDKPRVIGNFSLTSDDSQTFTKDNLKGHWTLMFFGFSNCGYVCPTTLAELNKMYVALKAQLPPTLLPQVVMVSVDPARDSVARMHAYVKTFNPAFIGVRGSIEKTKVLAEQMSVVFGKVEMPGKKNYMVNHSAELMLLDPNGNLRAFMSFPHTGQQIATDYKAILRAVAGGI